MARRTEMLLFRWLRPRHFILLMTISALLAFVCGYAISVGTGKVTALFPYISDTGTTPPASCVFGILLNIASVFGIVVIYIRHSHLEGNLSDSHRIHVTNDVAMFLGVLSCIGMMMVASFQWTEVMIPHLVGAFMVFVLGNIYCWLQSYISYVTIGGMTTKVKFIIRVILSAISTLAFVLTFMFAGMASQGKVKDALHWNSNDPGYSQHLGSTFSEWIMAACFLIFFLTLYGEFKDIESKVHVNSRMADVVVVEQ